MSGSQTYSKFVMNFLGSLGDPRVNIQNDKGKAKTYQVRQVLLAIDKLKERQNEN